MISILEHGNQLALLSYMLLADRHSQRGPVLHHKVEEDCAWGFLSGYEEEEGPTFGGH